MKAIAKKRINRSAGGDAAIFLLLMTAGLFMVIPMIFIISNAFKPLDELWMYPPRFFVRNPTFKNFKDLSIAVSTSWVPFSRYIFNTVFVSVTGTAGHVLIASMCAYPLAKYRFPFRNMIFSTIIIALMFNPAVTTIPNYLILSRIGLVNNLFGLLLPAFAMPLGLYLMKQFMEQMVPDSLLEAAKIDGAKEGTVFFRIVMPIVKPAWLTLILFSFQGLWGIANSNIIYSEQLKTLQYALNSIKDSGLARAGAYSAGALLMLAVPVTLFLITQSNILETMSTSGMKG
ncbi:MAG: carbohydrate ABC transporter permease [Saccharofermentanales bacterium]